MCAGALPFPVARWGVFWLRARDRLFWLRLHDWGLWLVRRLGGRCAAQTPLASTAMDRTGVLVGEGPIVALLGALGLACPVIRTPVTNTAAPRLTTAIDGFNKLKSLKKNAATPRILRRRVGALGSLASHPFVIGLVILSRRSSAALSDTVPT